MARKIILVPMEIVAAAAALGFTAQSVATNRPDGRIGEEDVEFIKGAWCVHLTSRGWRMVNRADPSRLYIRSTDYRNTALTAMEALL